MVLLGDEDQVEACFCPFVNSANLNVILVYCLRQTYHRLRKRFDCTRWNSKVTCIMLNLISAYLETMLVPVQYRCKVGARFAQNVPCAQKSFWTHSLVHLGDEAQV
jgi:hypothetical protein